MNSRVNYMKNTPKLLFIAVVVATLLYAIHLNGNAQIPVPDVIVIEEGPNRNDPNKTVCIYHPERLSNGAYSSDRIIFHTDGTYWPKPVMALQFIKSEWNTTNSFRRANAAAAAIQYSLSTPNLRAMAEDTKIANYLPSTNPKDIPDITLAYLIRQYLFVGNIQYRNNINYWMLEIVNSSTNRSCNPWYPYTK